MSERPDHKQLVEDASKRVLKALTSRTATRAAREAVQPADPSSALTAYSAAFTRYAQRAEVLVERLVLSQLPVLGSGDPLDLPALEAGIARLHVELNVLGERLANQSGAYAAKRVATNARREVERLLGVKVDPTLQDDLMQLEFTQRNARLMRKMAARQITKIREAVAGYQEGDSMRRAILHQLWVVRHNGQLIARDQVWRFQREAISRWSRAYGSPGGIYHTRRDEKVRPTHAAHDGQFFLWGQEPSTLQEPNCRCKIIPLREGT